MNELVAMYREGSITGYQLMLHSLHMVDPQTPALVLGWLPEEILGEMVEYIRRYRPESMISKPGLPPSADQVEAAHGWIEEQRAKMVKARQASCLQ